MNPVVQKQSGVIHRQRERTYFGVERRIKGRPKANRSRIREEANGDYYFAKRKLFPNLGQKLEQTCSMLNRLRGHDDFLCQIDQRDSSKGKILFPLDVQVPDSN